MEQTKQNTMDTSSILGSMPVGKLLMRFSIPCVMSLLVSALYNIVDQIFIGQGVGYVGNAATNIVYPITVIALAFALFIGDGCAALVSLSQGAGDKKTGHRAIGTSMIAVTGISVLLMIAGYVFMDPIISAFGGTPATYEYASSYMKIILAGVPFYMIGSGLNGIIRADGSPKFSMIATLTGAIINIILDPIAIFVLGWGVAGAALATIIGQIASCVMTLLYFRKPKTVQLNKESFQFDVRIFKKVCSLGISSFITQLSIVIVIAVMNNTLVNYGMQSEYGADIPLSVIGIVMKVFGIIVSIIIGISIGGQPIIGYNFGAGNYKRVRQTYHYILSASIIVGIIATVAFEIFPDSIIRMFGSESDLYNRFARLCFRVYLSGILLTCIQKASCIFLQAIGRPIQSMIASLTRDLLLIIPGIIILAKIAGLEGILLAGPIADILSIIVTAILILLEYRAIHKLELAQAK